MEPIVIARAPGHISFGWGSSLPGADASPDERLTISAAINYYAYTIVSPSQDNDVRITVAGSQTLPWYIPEDFPWGTELALPKAILRLFGTRGGLNIFLSTQAPLGIGLGLSGSLAVSMIKALAFTCGLDL
ncbi:MAG: GHMP family kinase ATP-binding protein, partial [Anaerolineae bacterium]